MLEPGKLEKAFPQIENENWEFRSFLKAQNEDEVDRLAWKFHQELFAEMDCIACSNCCRVTATTLNKRDVARISRRLKMSPEDFHAQYVRKKDNGELRFKSIPCPFLTPEGCSVYDSRPKTCREYPHTDKCEFNSRLIFLVNQCSVCPVVFEIFERLKEHYREDFEEFQEEMRELFGEWS